MFKKLAMFGLVGLTALVIAVGVLAYSFLKPTAEATGPIQAIALTPSASTAAAAATGTTTFTIDQASSEARFIIDEVLNGADKTVVGTTDQVAGQIAVSPTSPSTAQVGTIQINARTLTTDSENRNRAIQNRILLTEQYEYITFVPTATTGLPTTATAGQPYTFQITGQLTVAGQTREATFDVTVTPTASGTLEGTATTTIRYADWNLTIPSVPSVASVEDTLTLELDFVATAS